MALPPRLSQVGRCVPQWSGCKCEIDYMQSMDEYHVVTRIEPTTFSFGDDSFGQTELVGRLATVCVNQSVNILFYVCPHRGDIIQKQ